MMEYFAPSKTAVDTKKKKPGKLPGFNPTPVNSYPPKLLN
jgi:hypothetical protein